MCCMCFYYSKNAEMLMSWPLGLTLNNDNNQVGLRRISHVSIKEFTKNKSQLS